MKLVEILAKELGEWPEGVTHAVQDHKKPYKRKVWLCTGDMVNTTHSEKEWMLGSGVFPKSCSFIADELATDHATAIVTRKMWQAERNKQSCERVEEVAEIIRSDTSAFLDAVMALPSEDDPRTLRDRIREIDASIEAMTDERADLVQKLASEGFALIGRINELLTEAAQKHEDMSDWRNWKAGDILEVVSNTVNHGFNTGETVRYKKEFGSIGCGGKCELLDCSDWWAMDQCDLKFHSRPSA